MAVGNPLGAVCLWDGENPRTFTGKARETISGGQFVYVSGADSAAQVGSQASSFVTSDLALAVCNKWAMCNGIALTNAGSGELVTVATRGNYLIKAGGPVSGGMLVTNLAASDAVYGFSAVGSGYLGAIGRSLTNAGSEGYCLVALNL